MVSTALACALASIAAFFAPPPPSSETSSSESSSAGSKAESSSGEASASEYRTEVLVGRDRGDGLAAQRRLSRRDIGFATAIDLEREPGRPPADDLARVVSRAPGVTVRSLGGLGQFSAVSIRGSGSQQVPVFLDGAPLSGSAAGLVDLSTQPLDALTRVEIHRGHVPIRYGSAGIGGAIDLIGKVHRGPPRLWLAGGFGSFLAREARAGFATKVARGLSLATRIGYAGARGDFPFFDDGGTPLLPADDGISRRINNHYDRLFAQIRLDLRRGALTLAHQEIGWWKLQGLPGTASAPSPDASLRIGSLRSITRVRVGGLGRPEMPGHVEWVGSFALEDRVLRDPLGQVGLAADDERGLTLDGWISPRLRAPLWTDARLDLLGELRGEWVRIDERFGESGAPALGPLASGDATRTRISSALGLEIQQWLFADHLSLAAGARLDLADSHFAVPPGEGEVDDAGRDRVDLGVSPRLATKIRILEGLELRGSVGRYFRFPNLIELFGDRGPLVGNEGLRPELGTKIDGGLLLELEGISDELAIFAQLVGFVTWSEELIQWVRSGPVIRPLNLPGARVRGLEGGLSLRAFGRDLALDLAYTLLDSRNAGPELEQLGKPLPGRPRHTLLVRPAVGRRFSARGKGGVSIEPRVFYELEWIAGTTLDLSGRVELPPRWLQAAGISLRLVDRVELAVEARNLANLRRVRITPAFGPSTPYPVALSDFIGFPLPGLSVWTTLRVDLSLASKAKGAS